tara:strand:- start:3867 stop:4049 length:183 start_codon:yes stop_codon:yes gene_type:complete
MTEFFYWLGDTFTAFFDIFKNAGNLPNYIFIAVGFGLLFWWLGLQKKYNAKAAADPKQLK